LIPVVIISIYFVFPGVLDVNAILLLSNVFIRVDLPTLDLPKNATFLHYLLLI